MDIEHDCSGLQKENDGIKSVGIDFKIWIEYHPVQNLWLLQTSAKIPSIIIQNCPFCGYRLAEDR